ncbi:hypothetical protein [Kangiella koreensis]|uniref:Zinc ribbon domain-containing protein n=1 Tax=Kangiella koreensis (strain DSM 16069 / JCM 12317 / KCTC 12182 / SW-125) TaxID=523791 RepID=C7RCA8_KANKD|nr:hypothetical protein [Kangiella koreensis]ACV26900.1 conserved hypothetical protein [Kangiella koreensis DSM 16069]
MSIISCIVCGKRISSKSEVCMHCGAVLKGTSEEQLERAIHIQKIKRSRRIQSFSFLAILLVAAGFLLNFVHPKENGAMWVTVSYYMIAAGFVGYIALRVWLMFLKKK